MTEQELPEISWVAVNTPNSCDSWWQLHGCIHFLNIHQADQLQFVHFSAYRISVAKTDLSLEDVREAG